MARDRKRVDVLVLGAGAAGLAAARDLSHAGLRVTIIEARPRVGGRILTLHDSRSPVPLELGAEFIHGARAETLSLAQAAGLAVLELPGLHDLAAAGRFKAMDGFWELVDRMNKDLARRLVRRGRDFPVSEYLDSRSVPPARRGMLRDFLQGFYAAHPDRLSAESLAVEARGEGNAERDEVAGGQFRIANGGDALMKWLRDGLDPDRTELRLSTVAQTVEWKRESVRVGCRGADRAPLPTVSARTAVITLPLAVLKAGMVRFEPALPAKQRALAGLETGQVFKIVLRCREAIWDDAEFLKERRGPSSAPRALAGARRIRRRRRRRTAPRRGAALAAGAHAGGAVRDSGRPAARSGGSARCVCQSRLARRSVRAGRLQLHRRRWHRCPAGPGPARGGNALLRRRSDRRPADRHGRRCAGKR